MSSLPQDIIDNAARAHRAIAALGLIAVPDHAKLTAGRAFMPLSVEWTQEDAGGWRSLSLCHYFEQNGDLCQDPEMLLWVNDARRLVLPGFFQQAIPPVYREAITKIGDAGISYRPRELRDQQAFLRQWLRNLKEQGFNYTEANPKADFDPYHGRTRAQYLRDLAEEYGVPLATVRDAAAMLGPNEDFDGLVTSLQDLADSGDY